MSYTDTYSFISEWNTHGLFINTVYTCAHRTPLLLYNNIDSVKDAVYNKNNIFRYNFPELTGSRLFNYLQQLSDSHLQFRLLYTLIFKYITF